MQAGTTVSTRLMCERGHVAKSADQATCDVVTGSTDARRQGRGKVCGLPVAPEPAVRRCPKCGKGLLVADDGGLLHCSYCPTAYKAPQASDEGGMAPGTRGGISTPSDLHVCPPKRPTTVPVRRRSKKGPSRTAIEAARWRVQQGRTKAHL